MGGSRTARNQYQPRLVQRTAHVEAYAAGRWVGDYAPNSPAHKEIMALTRAVEKALY